MPALIDGAQRVNGIKLYEMDVDGARGIFCLCKSGSARRT
jgi:hypothetical protein